MDTANYNTGAGAGLGLFFQGYNAMVGLLNSIPTIVENETIDMSKSIAYRLHQCGDIFSGKNEDASKAFAEIDKKHFDLLQNLRTQQPEKYTKLADVAKLVSTLSETQQAPVITAFIQEFLNTTR